MNPTTVSIVRINYPGMARRLLARLERLAAHETVFMRHFVVEAKRHRVHATAAAHPAGIEGGDGD